MKKIITIILTGIASMIIIAVIGLMISASLAIKNNEPVYIFNYALGVVPTDSMVGTHEDSLDVNDMYLMTKVSFEEISIGDVIIYQGITSSGENILVVHRVVDITDQGFITQGDNETYTDQEGIQSYITNDNLVGKYVEKITFLKPVSQMIQSQRSFIFLALIIIITLILIFEVVDLMRVFEKNKKEKLNQTHEEQMDKLREEMKQQLLKEIQNQ